MSASPAFAPITELARQLRAQRVSPLELVDEFASRITAQQPHSHAFISLDIDRARKLAASQRVRNDDNVLKGIPYACKDLIDVAGIVTSAGSRALEDNVANANAEVIERLDQSGAIYLGKTNLHEFAYGATGENRHFGTCPNPYDSTRLAGGSSSGSAAAVGFGLCSAALGTDTGGSVRAPAALCGLVGFKPTLNRISTKGIIPFSWSLDHVGSLTRTADDAERLFAILASDFEPWREPDPAGLTIGIPETFFFERCDPQIIASVEQLRHALGHSGVKFKTVSLPSMEFSRSVALTVQMPEALSYHNRYLDQRGHLYGADFRAGLALGQNLLAEQYVRALRMIESYRLDTARVFDDVDLLLTPACPTIAPKLGAVDIDFDGIGEPAGNAITRYTSFFNITGHPAITLPCGMHSAGLPIGAQLIGKHFADEFLLAVARKIEIEYGFEAPLPHLA